MRERERESGLEKTLFALLLTLELFLDKRLFANSQLASIHSAGCSRGNQQSYRIKFA